MRFARNKKEGKNGQNPFCPSTKTPRKRARTIMVVRYRNDDFVSQTAKILIFDTFCVDFILEKSA